MELAFLKFKNIIKMGSGVSLHFSHLNSTGHSTTDTLCMDEHTAFIVTQGSR